VKTQIEKKVLPTSKTVLALVVVVCLSGGLSNNAAQQTIFNVSSTDVLDKGKVTLS
jgi:hypothetical protein